MILYTGNSYNKSYIKEEGNPNFNNNQKNNKFNKSSLIFDRYKHFKYNKWRFESGNMPVDTILDCINKIVTILDKYVNDVSSFNPKLKKSIVKDLLKEKDEIIESKMKIGEELILKFNVDRLCENVIKYKINENQLDLNKYNIQVPVLETETDKNVSNKLDSKRTRSDKTKLAKPKPKSEMKRGRSSKKQEQIVDSSNLNYYIKYFNYLKLYYQYYLSHFVSVYIFYKSYGSNVSRIERGKSLVHIKDAERALFILGRLFTYLRRLVVLHLKCLINLLPLSFVYNPDNFIDYSSMADYNEIMNNKMNSLSDIDNGLKTELKRELFDGSETDRKFDVEEFNEFLSKNNLSHFLSDASKATATAATSTTGDSSLVSVGFDSTATYAHNSDTNAGFNIDARLSFTSPNGACGTYAFTHNITHPTFTTNANCNASASSNNHDSGLVTMSDTSSCLVNTSTGSDATGSAGIIDAKMSSGEASAAETASTSVNSCNDAANSAHCATTNGGNKNCTIHHITSGADNKHINAKQSNGRHHEAKYNEGRSDGRNEEAKQHSTYRETKYEGRYYDPKYDDRKYNNIKHYNKYHDSRYHDGKYDRKYTEARSSDGNFHDKGYHDGKYGDIRYHYVRYAGRRSNSHSSSSSGSFRSDTNESRAERHNYHSSTHRSNSSGSGSTHGVSRSYALYGEQERVPVKREQQTHRQSYSADQSSSNVYSKDAKKVKLDSFEKERLGKELKSGKKLKSSNKFNTMNIKEIFDNIASKSTSAKPTSNAYNKHLGYKSTGQATDTKARADPNKGSHYTGDKNVTGSCDATDERVSKNMDAGRIGGGGDSTVGRGATGPTDYNKVIDGTDKGDCREQ